MILIFTACTQNESLIQIDKDSQLNLIVLTRSSIDNMVKDGDGTFSSLALYVFNKADGSCEYSELIPAITPESVTKLTRSVNVSPQIKEIYVIGNYNANGIVLTPSLSKTTTRDELEKLTAYNDQPFNESSILMVGKQEVYVSDTQVSAEIPMERLVARIDIHMFKNDKLKDVPVRVVSIEMINQITNTNGQYQNSSMLSSVSTNNISVDTDSQLNTMSSETPELIPKNALTSFYSYQNITSSFIPDDHITPYLRVTAEIDGKKHIYRGYITDNGQIKNKYSLLRNTVYTVIIMLEYPDNKLQIQTVVQPWTVSQSQIGYEIKDSDYSLNALDEDNAGALGGYVQYPYIKNGQSENKTSYASYNFRLIAPDGAVWTATLSNGLEFAFTTESLRPGSNASTRGIAGSNMYEIRIGATKPWNGNVKSTFFYITVNGIKLKINPLLNGKRKFPGNNDTDILISQTEYR